MRLTLIVVLCLLNAGCAIWRRDREEPVDNGPKKEKAEPELKPSDVLKPPHLEMASPITDHFYLRGIYYQPSVATTVRLDSTGALAPDGTVLNAERDLGLDDQINQGRMEFNFRLRPNHQVRVDYFKLSRFHEQRLADDINFGDFLFDAGTVFRSSLDWRMLSLTYTYSPVHTERFEAGFGLGLHIIEAHAQGREPGTLNMEKADAVAPFPTIAVNSAFRISKRWSVTARGQTFSAHPNEFDGSLSDYHGDLQYRWRRNFALGLGYSIMKVDVQLKDADQPMLFNMNVSGPELFFRASF